VSHLKSSLLTFGSCVMCRIGRVAILFVVAVSAFGPACVSALQDTNLLIENWSIYNGASEIQRYGAAAIADTKLVRPPQSVTFSAISR
jgi:hypothetical protein